MTKNLWVVANWKSNKNIAEALEWISLVGPKVERRDNLKVVVCPQFDALEEVKRAIQIANFPLLVGAQDLSPFTEGAYTGEESARALSDFVDLAILGHSERRQNFQETNEIVGKKTTQARSSNIVPLVCIQDSDTPVPQGVKLVAYEPIFAIGTDNPDTPENAGRIALALKQQYGEDLEVLYGGSVNADNCQSFIRQPNLSGLLIGRASLSAEEFGQIVDKCTYPHGS